jgi:hypothetical protein
MHFPTLKKEALFDVVNKTKTPDFAHLVLAIDCQRLCVAWAAEAGESDGF